MTSTVIPRSIMFLVIRMIPFLSCLASYGMSQRGRGEHIPDERRQLMTGVAALVRDGEQPERMARTANNNPPYKGDGSGGAREGDPPSVVPGMSSCLGEERSGCYPTEYPNTRN